MPACAHQEEETGMQVPLKSISMAWRLPRSSSGGSRRGLPKLLRFHDRMIGCRVVVEAPAPPASAWQFLPDPHRGPDAGRDVEHQSLPGDSSRTDVYVALRDSFDAVERRLNEYGQRPLLARVAAMGGRRSRILRAGTSASKATDIAPALRFDRSARERQGRASGLPAPARLFLPQRPAIRSPAAPARARRTSPRGWPPAPAFG